MRSVLRSIWFAGLLLGLPLPLELGAQEGIFADFTTSKGSFSCELDWVRSPRAAANFIALATGERPWMEETSAQVSTHPFYDGLTFHRVIAGFMIQGGSPNGLGTDGPGYVFPDEFHPALRHDAPGILSMANSGPNSNGSQFFITVAATPWLDGVHTVFGRVVEGYAVVQAISQVDTDTQNRPREPVHLQQVRIRRIGAAAEAFDLHAHGLPQVTNQGLGIGRPEAGLELSVARPAHADLRLRESANLRDWTAYRLGIALEPVETDAIARGTDGTARFFSLTRIQYSSSTYAPRSLANRVLTMTFEGGSGTIEVKFDAVGGGVYSYSLGNEGTVTGMSWVQEVYRGRLTLSTSGLVPMVLRLDFTSETVGTLSGTVYSVPPTDVKGSFVLVARED